MSWEPTPIPFEPRVSFPFDPKSATSAAAFGVPAGADAVVAGVVAGVVVAGDAVGGVALASMVMNCALEASMTTW